MEELQFWPEDTQKYAVKGCKNVREKMNLYIYSNERSDLWNKTNNEWPPKLEVKCVKCLNYLNFWKFISQLVIGYQVDMPCMWFIIVL